MIPLDTLGVGLECDVGLTFDDMAKRFDLINQADVQEIDIWKVHLFVYLNIRCAAY